VWSFIMLGCCCKLILDVILMIYRCLLFIMKFTKAAAETAATAATPAPKDNEKKKKEKKKKEKAASTARGNKRKPLETKPQPKVTLFSRVCSSNVL